MYNNNILKMDLKGANIEKLKLKFIKMIGKV